MKILTRLEILPIILLGVIILNSCEKEKKSGLPTDGDGNEYDTVAIGSQVWLKENLKTTKYRNGDPIYLVTDNTKWISWPTGAYCWYDNKPEYKDTYGALYNYKAASTNSLCPEGWHVPSEIDWSQLVTHLESPEGQHNGGGKLKETGTLHWMQQSQYTTNETGFTALPSGRRILDGTFSDIKQHAFWWTTSFNTYVTVHYSTEYMEFGGYYDGKPGFSVRCLKDK